MKVGSIQDRLRASHLKLSRSLIAIKTNDIIAGEPDWDGRKVVSDVVASESWTCGNRSLLSCQQPATPINSIYFTITDEIPPIKLSSIICNRGQQVVSHCFTTSRHMLRYIESWLSFLLPAVAHLMQKSCQKSECDIIRLGRVRDGERRAH